MTYEEALRYLASIEGLGIKLALENITQVLAALGDPQSRYPSVLISGTNGKGSVAATLSSILSRAGYRTGLYTSPHLVRYEERIVVDGRPITAEAFAAAVGEVHDAVQPLLARGELTAHPTHFETVTAAAFAHLARAEVDIAVLEVGMGGRLDATVLARPRLSLVTNVALEHTAFLGDTIGAIAKEKAGILPEGGILLTGETQAEALEAFRRRAADVGGRLIELAKWAEIERRSVAAGPAGSAGQELRVRTPHRVHEGLVLALPGPHQTANAALAVAACDVLEEIGFTIPADSIRRGLSETRWPGRFQIVEGAPRVILDGAHNPAACRALHAALSADPGCTPGRTTLLFGVLRDKDHVAMMSELLPAASRVILTRGGHPRFREPSVLLEAIRDNGLDGVPEAGPSAVVFGGLGEPAKEGSSGTARAVRRVTIAETFEEALEEARAITPPDGSICVAGSLYLVGEAMQVLGIEPWGFDS